MQRFIFEGQVIVEKVVRPVKATGTLEELEQLLDEYRIVGIYPVEKHFTPVEDS